MPGMTIAEAQTVLDARFPTTGATAHIGYSTDGATEFGGLARTAIGATGWAAATAADPSVKANGTALTSAAATGAGTITHAAVFSASSAGTQRTEWTALDSPVAVVVGTQVTHAIGAIVVTLD